MQVVVACRPGMFRGGDERLEALGIERARQGGLLDPDDPRSLQLAEIQLADLAAAAATTRSRRPISTASPAAASRRRLRLRRFAELGGASHRGDRDRDRAPLPRRVPACFELERDVLVLAGEQRGAVPRSPVGLVTEQVGERLVGAPAFRQAGALRDAPSG